MYAAGLLVTALLIPTNVFLGRRNAVLQKQLLAYRDTRMRFLNEVISLLLPYFVFDILTSPLLSFVDTQRHACDQVFCVGRQFY